MLYDLAATEGGAAIRELGGTVNRAARCVIGAGMVLILLATGAADADGAPADENGPALLARAHDALQRAQATGGVPDGMWAARVAVVDGDLGAVTGQVTDAIETASGEARPTQASDDCETRIAALDSVRALVSDLLATLTDLRAGTSGAAADALDEAIAAVRAVPPLLDQLRAELEVLCGTAPAVPEAPFTALLPVVGLGMVTGAFGWQRRRQCRQERAAPR